MSEIVILGGGFGGLAAAHHLRAAHPELDVVLLDRRDHFFMGFAKLWDLAGRRPLAEGTMPLGALADRGVRFVQATVTDLDPAGRTVRTDAPGADAELVADGIIVALGSVPAPKHRDLLDGALGFDLYDAAALPTMRAALGELTSGRVLVSILGGPFACPPAPFEAVLIVDELLRARGVRDDVDVVISTPQPMTLPVAGPDASAFVASHVQARGIELLAGRAVREVDHDGGRVVFSDDTDLEVSVLLGVPAASAPPVLAAAGMVGESGFVEPDVATMCTAFERVYAIGDCTHVPNAVGALPKAGVFAAAEGEVAAANLAADLLGGQRRTLDGHGFCFLELPGEQVAMVEGDFLAEPRPQVSLSDASNEHFRRKQAFERDRLAAWLGGGPEG